MKVVRTKELPWTDALQKGAYFNRRKELVAGERLACSLWELAPGKKSFPLHVHHVTEEGLFVVSGTAKVRTPEGLTPVGPGDFVSFPAGGAAHQLINDGTEPFIYVGVSAVQGVDVVDYPDSDKVAAAVGRYPAARRVIFKNADKADYFADDKDAQ